MCLQIRDPHVPHETRNKTDTCRGISTINLGRLALSTLTSTIDSWQRCPQTPIFGMASIGRCFDSFHPAEQLCFWKHIKKEAAQVDRSTSATYLWLKLLKIYRYLNSQMVKLFIFMGHLSRSIIHQCLTPCQVRICWSFSRLGDKTKMKWPRVGCRWEVAMSHDREWCCCCCCWWWWGGWGWWRWRLTLLVVMVWALWALAPVLTALVKLVLGMGECNWSSL